MNTLYNIREYIKLPYSGYVPRISTICYCVQEREQWQYNNYTKFYI